MLSRLVFQRTRDIKTPHVTTEHKPTWWNRPLRRKTSAWCCGLK
jgi:hypothetical protein